MNARRPQRRRLGALLVLAMVLLGLAPLTKPAGAAPAFRQARAKAVRGGTTNNLKFNSVNVSGNLIVVYAVWDNIGPVTISDSRGNAYASAGARQSWGPNWSSQVFYAKNIVGGSNTVTAVFGSSISSFGQIYIHEYSGLNTTSPLDVSSAATGTSSAMNSGPATTTSNDLLFAAGASSATVTAGDPAFTTRLTSFGRRTMDRSVTTAGSYSATATQSGNAWALHMVAFRAQAGDTTPPTAPTGLTATAASSTQINLSWNASTDDVGVAGYRVFRNGAQVATTASTSYQDTGLTPSTTYSYTVSAFDGAGNNSALSTPASATTGAPDTTPPQVSVTAPLDGATVSMTIAVTANASDNVGVVGVQFFLDGANLNAEDTTSPYSTSWNTSSAPNGPHTLTARARDAAGNATTSTAVTVTVNNSPSPPGGLVAGYAFNEGTGITAADASGHGLTGTLNGGAGWGTGNYGSAVALDGVDDYVDLGNPAALQLTGSLTASAWIYSGAFPSDDAAVISKRNGSEVGYQLDTTIDRGPRTIGFKLTSSSGGTMFRYGATALQLNTWYHIAGVYNATARTIDVYLNGVLDNGTLLGTVTSSQQNSSSNAIIGRRGTGGFNFNGRIDDTRLYNRPLTGPEIQTDMNTPLVPSSDPTPPTVAITSPPNNAQVSDIVNIMATADDNVGVAGVQFMVDGVNRGAEDTAAPYAFAWDTRTVANGAHTLTARARDTGGNTATSAPIVVNVANANFFQNEILATGFDLPTNIEFLPDGRMLVVELQGTIKVMSPPYTSPSPTPFLQLTNVGSNGVQQGIYDVVLDPNFTSNHFYYVFYTLGTPNRDRLSRFTANSTLTGTNAGSELVLYQDPRDANAEHHGGAMAFANDGKLFFTTGEHFNAGDAQLLTNPRGKIHRINPNGTVPNDNPFNDGPGPNVDSIWAYGLRNPFRASYDSVTGKLYVGDVGGNDYSTAYEEVDLGVAGANYGWPNCEVGTCGNPNYTAALYAYPHNGRDASITGGFVYRGSQFPASYQGAYFFADYTQNWIRNLTFDASGGVSGVFNFEPPDGTVDGPYGDIVDLTQGPDGALYYVDLGYSDISGTFGVSKLRRISYTQSNQAPVAGASANPTSGPAPLNVAFSSAGSFDPEGQPITYLWSFGDGTTSTAPNPTHTYTQAGPYTARLTVSDGVNSTLSTPITISVGNPPSAMITAPGDGLLFRAGDVIAFSGDASDPEDGQLPASAFTWNIDFLHEGHVHPGLPITGAKSGSFAIPTSGHDFSGNTRYRITLTVTDSSGLTTSRSVTVYPDKVNLTFNTSPTGLTLYLDGIAKTTPFVHDTLIGFNHTIEARNQTAGTTAYTFASWSDGGAQQHTIVVPSTPATYVATYTTAPVPIAFVQLNYAAPQQNQSSVPVTYTGVQTPGNTNIVAVGWNDATSTISSVTDTAGNTYQLAAPIARGNGVSQAIYYAKNIVASPAGANTVTATFNVAVSFADVRVTEYSGLDTVNPFDVAASASGTSSTASSGPVTTTAANELLFGAGMTTGAFTGATGGFTTRVITTPDQDIVADRVVNVEGTYSATATQGGSWVMQIATFKRATP